MSLLVKNIGCIVGIDESERTRVSGKDMSEIATLQNAWLLTDGTRIKDYGTMDTLPEAGEAEIIDAQGGWLFPSFCDSHTHIVYAGSREQEFLDKIGERTLVAFFAPMGSGKTTFTTALCKVLGVTDPVGSPTFAIVNEYMRADGEPMYHFDFYRINKLEEAIEIGLYDYLDSGCLCIMEWPENIEELLPEDTLCIHITVNPDQSRTLSWED